MILSLSSRDRAVLIAGIVAVVAIVGAGKGVPALRSWERSRIASALEARRQLALAEQGSATLEATRDSAAIRERRLGVLHAAMITASTGEAAAARLAALMEQIANEEGVTVGMVALRPDTAVRSGMVRVGVRMNAEGDVDGLAGVLFRLESHEMPILVRELIVSQSDPAAPQNRPEVLRFEVYAVTLARLERDEGARQGPTQATGGGSL